MAKINDTGPHSAELVDERGNVFARIEFTPTTNAASRKEELLDGAEHWCNGGEGTPEFRLASRLRALLSIRLSGPENLKTKQQITEKGLLASLNGYFKFFRDPANRTRRRDPGMPHGPRVQQPYSPGQRRRPNLAEQRKRSNPPGYPNPSDSRRR